MNRLKTKKITLPIFLISILFIIIYVGTYFAVKNKYRNIINSEIGAYIAVIKNNYPNVPEEEMIKIIQNQNNNTEGEEILKNYGYDEKQIYNTEINDFLNKLFCLYLIIMLLLVISLTIYFVIYNRKREKKVNEITKYIKNINNKIYDLKIEENSEDELSRLKNELYKITILLKETAENSKKESINLSKSLEDISHQLKTPLTSITIMLDNIMDNPNMEESIKQDFIKSINKQVELISSLVISLLNLAKFDSGTIKINNQEIEIGILINEAIENLSIMLELKNINIVFKGDKEAVFVADYKWQLEAITNIIKNSIEHSKENSNIYITVEDSSLFLKVIIKDEGEGINKKDLRHIFERFYKSENSSENSVGIGLAFAKTVIEKNNGFISVDSEVGKGAKFTIKYLR